MNQNLVGIGNQKGFKTQNQHEKKGLETFVLTNLEKKKSWLE